MKLGDRICEAARLGIAVCLVGLAATLVIGECFVAGDSEQCCNSYTIGCRKGSSAWNCSQSAAGGSAVTIRTVLVSESGRPGLPQTSLAPAR